MPSIRIAGFLIVLRTRDEWGHLPHVHVFRDGGELVVQLRLLSIRENNGMKEHDARRAMKVVGEINDQLLSMWEKYHG